MPARHKSLQHDLLHEADLTRMALVDERGCRRDIRSNGWIVLSEGVRSFENRSGRRNRFSSFGADLCSAISPGPKPNVKSGPDVFADALVPRDALVPWDAHIPRSLVPWDACFPERAVPAAAHLAPGALISPIIVSLISAALIDRIRRGVRVDARHALRPGVPRQLRLRMTMPSSQVIHGRTLRQWLSFCQTAR